MNPSVLNAVLQQLYYYPPSAYYPHPYPYGNYLIPALPTDNAVGSSAAASDVSGSAGDDVGDSVSEEPTAYAGYWTLPPASVVSAFQRNNDKPRSRIISALTRSIGLGNKRASPLMRLSSSSGLGQLGSIDGFSSSSSGGNGSMKKKKQKFRQLSKLVSFENALGVLTLLAFSLFLIVFYLNALVGAGRRRTAQDGALADDGEDGVNVALLEMLSNPDATASWYREVLPRFFHKFRTSIKKFVQVLRQAMELTYLDVVGTARAREPYESSQNGSADERNFESGVT